MRRLILTSALLGIVGCSGSKDRPPYASTYNVGSGGSGFVVGATGESCGPPVSDAGLCGNEVLPTQLDRPNLYFVIDASGSMGDPFDNGQSKYTAAVEAISGVLEQIGHRVSYGAAVFPINNGGDCGLPGREVSQTRAGDSVVCSINGIVGDRLTNLNEFLQKNVVPSGMTPLSATLKALEPTLTSLSGKTAVILATDGAPNCNSSISCGPELCELNLNHAVLSDGTICGGTLNCCDPTLVLNGNLNCVDSVATNAILSALLNHGVPTYVIGLPGSSPILGAVLDSMAVSGGTARPTSPRYYEANDSLTLADTLRAIATQLAVSCTITLSTTPPNWNQVNVYLDSQQVPQSTENGWKQVDETTLEIVGTFCNTLLTGNVYQVQVTAGCTTYVN